MKCRYLLVLWFGLTPLAYVFAFGPEGHRTVGAIADRLLKDKPVYAKAQTLIDGLTLEDAATLADRIKSWDHRSSQHPTEAGVAIAHHDNHGGFSLPNHPVIEDQLLKFVLANSAEITPGEPQHHVFHFTDVSVIGPGTYADARRGKSDTDLVHMIPFCIEVLKGQHENNDFQITKPLALILLSHYVGDIHQPLHVGAAYFKGGVIVNPDQPENEDAAADRGGNSLVFALAGAPSHGHRPLKFHAYWDDQAVVTAVGLVPHDQPPHFGVPESFHDDTFIDWCVKHQPAIDADESIAPERRAEAWANEILPLARQAHTKVSITISSSAQKTANGTAEGDQTYKQFAGKTVKDEINKAGWRLAKLIEDVLK